MSKSRLGKGLGALISSTPEIITHDLGKNNIIELEVKKIKANSFQPRKSFDADKLAELAASIKEHGVVQPIIVRTSGNKYELVVGERRLRACKQLGLTKIPALIKEYTDEEMTEVALIENIQRHDLNPIEEAYAYKRLMEEFDLTQEEVAQKVGKSRSFIANFLRILQLPDIVLKLVQDEKLTIGHVRPLLALKDKEEQINTAKYIFEKNLSVRETERLIKKLLKPEKKAKEKNSSSPLIIDLQDQLRSKFGTKVMIKDNGNTGRIEIEFYNQEDLKRIIELIIE